MRKPTMNGPCSIYAELQFARCYRRVDLGNPTSQDFSCCGENPQKLDTQNPSAAFLLKAEESDATYPLVICYIADIAIENGHRIGGFTY